LSKVPARADGTVDLAALERALAEAPAPALVSVMLANNETGAIQPLADVVRLARKRGALVHTDAVQAAGRIAVAFADLGVDLMTLSAHKLGGPAGAGALLARDGVALRPLLVGGGQERGLRAGTENVAGIVGFGVAAELAAADLPQMGEVARLRDELERRVGAAVPEAVVHGAAAPRLPNTSCIGGTGVAAETQVMALDLAGVAVSAGAACTSGKLRPSHVLEAMGLGADAARTAIRVSLGRGTRAEDIDRFLAAWTALVARARRRAAEPAA
jgi:cysteine desulfurase